MDEHDARISPRMGMKIKLRNICIYFKSGLIEQFRYFEVKIYQKSCKYELVSVIH